MRMTTEEAFVKVLQEQRERILKTRTQHDSTVEQLAFGFADHELRQLRDNRSYWDKRLARIERDLELEPAALRELHWHPNADEWQYLLTGTIRATLFGSRGRYREATLGAGDVGYIPQGYGHSLENIGAEPARILIVFNAGEYQTVDLSQWIAGQPADVLAVNFGRPAATFEAFPKRDVFMTDG